MTHLLKRSRWGAIPLFLFLLGVSAPAEAADAPLPARAAPILLASPAAPEANGESAKKKSTKKKSSKKKKKKKKKAKPKLKMSGTFALRFIYDDNIIHYSDEDLDEFAHAVNFGKYSIETAHDWIVRPRIDISVETPAITGRDLEISLRASSWRYANNGVKNNESYQIQFKHPGFGGDNFQLTWYYAPLSYIRNFRDRAAYVSQAAPLEYHDFSYTSNSLTLGYWRKISSSWAGKAEVKRSWRYFTREFMENDNWAWRYGGYVQWRFSKPLRLHLEYYYDDVLARGADEVGETRFDSNESDPTYVRDAYEVALRFYASRYLPVIRSMNLSWQYQVYYFTTEKPYYEDPLHTGREDLVRRIEITGDLGQIFGSIGLEAGYRFTKRTSSAAWEGGTDDSGIGEEKDYDENRTWVGFDYPF